MKHNENLTLLLNTGSGRAGILDIVVNLSVADASRGELDGGDDWAGGASRGDGQHLLVSESLDTERPLSPSQVIRARGQPGTRGAGTETRVH